MGRIVIHTNFTATASVVHDLPLAELHTPRNLEILRALFFEPEKLKPGRTSEAITAEAAQRIAEIAQRLRDRGLEPEDVARFLDRIVFCLFAEDVGLLPKNLFTRIVEKTGEDPARFRMLIGQLFHAMAEGGDFGMETIRHFNGNLFVDGVVLELTAEEVRIVHEAAVLDWAAVDASIFGTLFERGLDPSKRSQLGAHYTSREDIETLVEPVVMQPLRREWEAIRQVVENLLTTGRKKPRKSAGVAQPPPAGQMPYVAQSPSAGEFAHPRAGVPHTATGTAQSGATVPHTDGESAHAGAGVPHAQPAWKQAIADAAKELDNLRSGWLNPPEWTREEVLEFPGSADGPWARYVVDADARGIGTVRYPRLVPRDEPSAKKLKKRTLTNLYNDRPTWLDLAHRKLDEAVFAAYGWEPDMADEQILERLLELNQARA